MGVFSIWMRLSRCNLVDAANINPTRWLLGYRQRQSTYNNINSFCLLKSDSFDACATWAEPQQNDMTTLATNEGDAQTEDRRRRSESKSSFHELSQQHHCRRRQISFSLVQNRKKKSEGETTVRPLKAFVNETGLCIRCTHRHIAAHMHMPAAIAI